MKKYFKIINWSVLVVMFFVIGNFVVIGETVNIAYAQVGDGGEDEAEGIMDRLKAFVFDPIQKPTLSFDFGVKFTEKNCDKTRDIGSGENKRTVRICEIPWLSEYIAGLYRYGVSVAAILAVVMIMVGGFIWLSSGGNEARVKTAKEYIASALAGLVLALLSFIILNSINPRLTSLDTLKVESYEQVKKDVPSPSPSPSYQSYQILLCCRIRGSGPTQFTTDNTFSDCVTRNYTLCSEGERCVPDGNSQYMCQ